MISSVVYPENLIGSNWCPEAAFLGMFLDLECELGQARILSLFCVSRWRFTENLLTPPHIKTCNRRTKHKQENTLTIKSKTPFNPEESQVGEVPACKRQNHGAKEMYG